MQKIFFVAPHLSGFVRTDLEILKEGRGFSKAIFYKAAKNPVYLIYTIIRIFLGVIRTDLSYVWFADFRAYLTVFFSKLFRKKVIVVVGGYETASLKEINYGGLLRPGQSRRFRYILKNADRIVTASRFSLNEVLEFHPVENISVVHLGIPAEEKLTPSNKLDWIITVGNATEMSSRIKGLYYFAEATSFFQEYKSIIVGKFEDSIKEKLLKINPGLEFTGYLTRDKLIDIYKNARIYCQLSMRESFGLSVLEAMSYGCIPVVTETGALPEVIGNTGYFTEYGDVKKTVSALKRALENGEPLEAKSRAFKEFSLAKRKEKIISLIESLHEN
jgi:glycosyltransferase involved in cell wall biosynthesis